MKEPQNVLQVYEMASGQSINFGKSETFYSANTDEPRRKTMSDIIGVPVRIGGGKYLGMSSLIGRSRKAKFFEGEDLEENQLTIR